MRRKSGGLVVLSAKMPPGLADQVRQVAAQSGETVSVVINRLLHDALSDGAGSRVKRDLADEGYQAGVRAGLSEVHQHMKKLFR